jgi:hypothetical protein
MLNSVKRIIDVANVQKKETYNILTFPTHERYETQLCKTGHNFYSFHLPNLKKWNSSQIIPPDNYYILPEERLCEYIPYDFILVQSKYWQYQVAQQINNTLNLPIVCLEHTLPTPQTISKQNLELMRKMVGNINVFISKYSQRAWNINYNTKIIHHGIDSSTFTDTNLVKEDYVLTVANDFINRDYCLNYSGWQRVTKDLKVRLVGETKGLSQPASSTEELVSEYNKCKVYFNSSTLSPIPTSLLEAMSCGCAVVSTATCMIPEIIENGVNGFISNDENELRSYIELLLNDNELNRSIGQKARQTIIDKFSEDRFVNEWNNIFDAIYEVSTR